MSETLIIAIIAQVVTLLIVVIQQYFSNRNLKIQIKNENKKQFLQEKREAYKLLVSKTNIDMFQDKKEISVLDLDFFFKDVYIYASKEVHSKFMDFYNLYLKIVDLKEKNVSDKTIEKYAYQLGILSTELIDAIKQEFEDL